MKIDTAKLAKVTARVDEMAERIDYWMSERMPAPAVLRRADKTWDESKHPRGPDGKFVEGEGAAAASAAEYLSQQQKAGKKGTPNGMMQHLLMNGGISKQEIWETTKANFEMAPHLNNYVSAVLATLKKKGIDVPEPPKATKGADKPAANKAEAKEEAKEEKPAAGGNTKEVQAWEKTIGESMDKADIPIIAEDLQYALGKKLLTPDEYKNLTDNLTAKYHELVAKATPADPDAPTPGAASAGAPKDAGQMMKEALAELPKPANTQEDDIAWMAKNQMYSAAEKLKYIAEMKVAPSSQPYKDKAMAAVALGTGKEAPPTADPELTTVKMGGGAAAGVEPTLPKPWPNPAQINAHAVAADPALSVETKIAQLKVEHSAVKGQANKTYIYSLIEALSGGQPATPPAPTALPKPPPVPLAQTQALQGELAGLKQKWTGILAVNKPPVDAMAQQLDKALSLPTGDEQAQALSQITPIPGPVGMGQQSANAFLAKAQQAAGIAPTTPGHPSNAPLSSSLPKGPGKKLQSEIFHALEDAPAVYIETAAKFESAAGKIKAKNVIDTDKIPKDQYAAVTAAYGADRDNGMTQAVDKAMRDYSAYSFDKLDADTKAAVASYQGTGYGSINGALLAGGDGAGKTKEKIQLIKKAIEKSAVPADTPAFRGMRCTLKDLSGFDDPAQSVGRAFVHKNFASISRSEAKARDFGEQVMLKMTIPAGTRGLVMGKQDWEREIMLQANSVFRIDKVEQKVTGSGKAQHLVHVTYMGTKEDA